MKTVQFDQSSRSPLQELANLHVWMEDARSFSKDAEGLLEKIAWIYENAINEMWFKDQLAADIILAFYNFSLNSQKKFINAELLRFAFRNYRTNLHTSRDNRLTVKRVNHLGRYLKLQS